MKKKTFRALKEAYYNELKKIGVIDTPKVKTLEEHTVKELLEIAENEGLILGKAITKKADIINAISTHREEKKALEEEKQMLLEQLKEKQELTEDNFNMTNDELKALLEELNNTDDSNDDNEDGERQPDSNEEDELTEEGKEGV